MTNSSRKRLIKERQAKTKEPYQVARRHVVGERSAAAKAPQSEPQTPVASPVAQTTREPRTSITPLERQAFDALQDYARAPVVFLLDGSIGTGAATAAVGSGTLLKTPAGTIVLLSAAHVFDDMPLDGMAMGGKTPDGVSQAIVRVWRHPSADVAVALVSAKAAAMFGQFAVSTDIVARANDSAFEIENPMVICGYPAAYRATRVDRARAAAHVELACVSYLTTVELELDSRARYRVTWKEAVLTEFDRVEPAVRPGEVFTIAHPRGISGGPLWRFQKLGKGELWAPAKMAKVVGIASTYLDGVEFCPSVASWGDWFRDTIDAIDKPSSNATKVFAREDVRRCGALVPDLGEWAESKTHAEEAHITYEHVETRVDRAGGIPVVAREFVTAAATRLDGKPAWKFSGRIDAHLVGLEPKSTNDLKRWLRDDLGAERVDFHSYAGDIAEVDVFWLAKPPEFDRGAAEKLVTDLGLA